MKFAKNTKKGFFKEKIVLYHVIFYQILMLFRFLENFLRSPLKKLTKKK